METDDAGVNITGLTAFTVNGVSYTNVRMISNGSLILYNTTAPTTTAFYSPLSTASGGGRPLWLLLHLEET
ncbi:MAG: hypothetical protein HWD63_16200 [Candidatus Parvibacillus calidus]|nr:MAG: hypothetical protein HWD63_16200 [Candidatus Parvibacillus calidus]